MLTSDSFWGVVLMRGLLALCTGACILLLPSMIQSWVLLPLAVAFSVVILAVYGVLDSALLMATSRVLPIHDCARWFIAFQGFFGLAFCAVWLWRPFTEASLRFVATAAAVQAACIAATDLTLGISLRSRHGSPWVQLSACISIVYAVALLLCRNLEPDHLAWLIVGYVVTLGFNFSLLSIWMLSDRRGAAKKRLRHQDLLKASHS